MGEHGAKERLSRGRAFVVQFGDEAQPDGALAGRAEHIASGKSRRFASLAELLAFIASALGARAAPSAGADGGEGSEP